jgi:hypothetical protein
MGLFWVSLPCSGRVFRHPFSCTARRRNPNKTMSWWTSTVITLKLLSPITSSLTRKINWLGSRVYATFRNMLLSYGTKWVSGTVQAETVQFCTVASRGSRQGSHRIIQIQRPAGQHRDRDSIEITVNNLLPCMLYRKLHCCTGRSSAPFLPSSKPSGRAAAAAAADSNDVVHKRTTTSLQTRL